MRRSWHGTVRLLAAGVAAGALVLWACPLPAAEEPCEQFLELLRKQAYYDTAVDYLESMRKCPLANPSFVEMIDCEMGLTLVASTVQLPRSDREKRLNEARSYFEKFLNEHAKHPRALTASVSLSNLLVERGRIKMDLATTGKRSPDQKNSLIRDARALYNEAKDLYTIIEAELTDVLKHYKEVDPDDSQRLQDRSALRTDQMETRHALTKIVYEIAKTYAPGTPEHANGMKQAAGQFGDYYKKYSRWVGGYYARIDEARCYKDLGDYSKTLEILGDMMSQPESDDSLRRMRSRATMLALQTAVLPEVKRYEDALRMYRLWDKNIAKRGETTEEALIIKCLAAEAALEQGRSIRADDPQFAKARYDLFQLAKNLATFSSQYPSEYQRQARLLLADRLLGGRVKVQAARTFDEARDRARIAWDRLQVQTLSVEEESQFQAEALENFRAALAKAPRDASLDELNAMRYCMAYLYWTMSEYYDAAVLGEFLARRYPNSPEATQGAKIALASYSRLIENAPAEEDMRLERRLMMAIVQYIPTRWPDSAAADEAWMIMIQIAVRKHDLAKMVELLDRVSPDSPRRGDTELMAGQALWASYVASSRLPEAERPDKAELDKIFVQANKTLEDGINRMRKTVDAGGEMPPKLATATLSLAQICLNAGMAEKAIEWLDDPKIGPHTLTTSMNPVTDRSSFREEALKTTLRAYMAARQFDKAEKVMNEFEKLTDSEELLRVYVGLGRQLEASLKQAREKESPEVCAKITEGFVMVLARIASRPRRETTFNTMVWVAEMYMGLGASLDPGNWRPPAEAVQYYRKAAAVYREVIEASHADEKYAPRASAVLSVQVELARCLRRIGSYAEALETLVEVLKIQNNLVDAQREAAYVYQAWGEEKPANFLSAIKGGVEVKRKNGSTAFLVWGWGGIARRVQANDNYQDLYHEARYNLAFCRQQYAISRVGQERTEQLDQARRDILVVNRLFPEMGGKKWYDQYDTLVKSIQKYLGQREEGLKAFDAAATP